MTTILFLNLLLTIFIFLPGTLQHCQNDPDPNIVYERSREFYAGPWDNKIIVDLTQEILDNKIRSPVDIDDHDYKTQGLKFNNCDPRIKLTTHGFFVRDNFSRSSVYGIPSHKPVPETPKPTGKTPVSKDKSDEQPKKLQFNLPPTEKLQTKSNLLLPPNSDTQKAKETETGYKSQKPNKVLGDLLEIDFKLNHARGGLSQLTSKELDTYY
jgi:hypothetical protein